MASNGNLNFTNVNKVTFEGVGSAPNAVIDTTTGKIGVGVDDPGANLHVVGNCFVSTNLELGGTLIMGTVNVAARHNLSAITATGNSTPHTVEFTNPTTGLVTTGNVSVGGELTVGGDVNLLHTSNTASLKLNSNVVTEFPRSKKLMKFPRVALTSAAQTGSGYQDYYVTRSSQFSDYNAWEAFDEYNPVGGNTGSGAGWASTIPGTYSVSTGAETGTVQHHSGSVQGEWIQIQLPESIYLHDFVIESRSETTYGADGYDNGYPKSVVLYGSINGSSWVEIKQFTTGLRTFSEAHTENINETTHVYKYFALVVNTTQVVNNTTQVSHTAIGQIKLYGVPEYDPEANGVDVVVKSIPNVPNTDWLEVYYDAKDYTSGVVPDLSTNSLNGTLTNGATFDNSDGIGKFTFDGSNDYISGSIPSTFTGNQTYTFSTWIKPTSHPSSGFIGIFEAGTRSTDDAFGLYLNAGNIVHLAYGTNLATTTLAPVGQWTHITGTYTSGDRKVYANGVLLGQDTYSALTLAGTTLVVGANSGGTQPFTGSIANFRLFNRALTQDEIYQLYAYQKEYFGHGVLGMTLKAGRLGIGTSEPRAALDVRGILKISDRIDSPFFKTITIFDGDHPWTKSITGTLYTGYTVVVVANLQGYVSTAGGYTWTIQYKYNGSATWTTLKTVFQFFNTVSDHEEMSKVFIWKPLEDINFTDWQITFDGNANADDPVDLVLISLPIQ